MDLIAKIPNLRGGDLGVYHDRESGTLIVGGRQLDLSGVGKLVIALTNGVEAIREVQAQQEVG